ncbi:hypothetical protein LTR62_001754 [Meristemomyces frigidus]|uniref:Uncharacterized protein n=1 Tax=Meristemomyces frigidus TaxID=1508187 RepID=A0AAN7TMT7_9PEZI|nr:hypothetical protein LTR62_001754 [Meristemomyces frigidus]
MASKGAKPSLLFINAGSEGSDDPIAARRTIRSYATAHSHKSKPRTGQRHAKYKPLQYDTTESPSVAKIEARDQFGKSSLPGPTLFDATPVTVPMRSLDKQPTRKRQRSDDSMPSDPMKMSRLLLAPETISKSPLSEHISLLNPHQLESPSSRQQTLAAYVPAQTRDDDADDSIDEIAPACLEILTRNPFSQCPVPFQSWFSPLLHDWCNITISRTCVLLDFRPSEIRQYIQWMGTTLLTDPALYYTSLFLASGSAVVRGSCNINRGLWLRCQAVGALKQALADPLRATSMQMIWAVSQVALHEHMYGDRELAVQLHRPAQQRMIKLRGGIETLRLPGVAMKVMLWLDTYMAAESGTQAYFADLPVRFSHCGVQPLSREQALRVADGVSPLRHNHPGYGDHMHAAHHEERSWEYTDSRAIKDLETQSEAEVHEEAHH